MKQPSSIFFLGIGGIGMSALARYFKMRGCSVSGYDKTSTPLTDLLVEEGIHVFFSEDIAMLPEAGLVIYTPAVPKEHPAYQFYKEKGIPMKKRAEVLGMITDLSRTIAVAGTHGKTTTSTLIAHIMKNSGFSFMAFLGGISKDYDSNFITSENFTNQPLPETKPEYFVAEADEFDKSFLTIHPEVAVITSMDADHLDIYKEVTALQQSFSEFARNVRKNGSLIVKKGLKPDLGEGGDISLFSYSTDDSTDYGAVEVIIKNGMYHFDLLTPAGLIKDCTVG
ncbi:MAG: Mur ligase domain-containing protein, partial [Bacteroidota bacterium]